MGWLAAAGLPALGKVALVGVGGATLFAGACGRDERNPPHAPLTGGSVGSGAQGSGGVTTSTGAGGAGGQGGGGPAPEPNALPTAEGTCPVLDSGNAVVALTGMEPREVEVRVSSKAQTLDGPFVAVFRAENQSPSDAINAVLGADGLDEILNRGGVVVAPDADPTAGNGVYPWFTYLGNFDADGQPDPTDDFRVFDELLACAIKQHGIDTRRIHTMGFHEGSVMALHTAILRSGFVASTVAHSTAVTGAPAEQDGTNAYAAMLLFGGSTDTDSLIAYSKETPEAATALTTPDAPFSAAHFTILCNHAGGTDIADDAVPSTIEFLLDHPYRVVDEPYLDGLPKSFPSYCAIHD